MKTLLNRKYSYLFQRSRALTALVATAAAMLSLQSQAQKFTITQSWYATNGAAGTHITSVVNTEPNRGLAYNSASNQVLVANRSTPAIDVLNGSTGAYISSLNTTGVSGGTFVIDQVAASDDGSIYAGDLTTAINTTPFVLYRWADASQVPTIAFTGDPAGGTLPGKRMGDNIAIQGTGTNTIIMVPVQSGTTATTNVVLFSTANGSSYTPTVLNIAGMPAPASGGNGPTIAITFYTNNTFLFKQTSTSLYLVQYPANFASLAAPVQATVIATNPTFTASAVSQMVLSYSPAGGVLAALGPIPNSAATVAPFTTTPFNLYLANPFTGTGSSVGNSNSTHYNGNGNFVGGVALGGIGKTNMLFTMDANNGVYGWGLSFVAAPVSPVVSGPLVGGSVYTNLGSFTFNISANGTAPLVYYWQYNTVSNPATASTIFITTNLGTYTVSPLTLASSGWYSVIVSNSAGITNVPPVQLTVSTPLSNPSVTELWHIAADNSQPYLDTNYNTRGLAFDPNTMTVVVAEHSTTSMYALNATNGQYMYTLTSPSTGLPFGSIFPLGQVVVADDGVLYCCNVSSYNPTNSTAGGGPPPTYFSITRFSAISDPNVTPYSLAAAFTGDPGAYSPSNPGVSSQDRWGDSMAVRGAGVNTQILLGSYEPITSGGGYIFGTGPGTNVSLLTTTDGVNFTPTTIAVTNAPAGFSYLGVAFGLSNTFWAKSPGFNLRQVQYDLTTGIGTVIQSFATTASSGSLSGLCGIGLDNSNNILAGVNVSDTPNDLELFQIPTLGFPPQAYFQDFFPTNLPNINGNASTTIKYPYIFSLDANNGIIALQYSVPLVPFNILSTIVSGKQVLTYQTVIGHTYQVQSTTNLLGTNTVWSNAGSATTVSSSGTLSYTNNSPGTNVLFFRVQAH